MKNRIAVFLRRHFYINVLDILYKLKKRICNSESNVPHWYRKTSGKSKTTVLYMATDRGRGVSAVSRQFMHLNQWCKKRGFESVIFFNWDDKDSRVSDDSNYWNRLFVQSKSIDELIRGIDNILIVDPSFVPLDEEMEKKYVSLYDYPGCPVIRDKFLMHELYKDNGNYLTVKDEIKNYCSEWWESRGLNEKKVLGVVMREDFSLFNYLEKGKCYDGVYFSDGSHPVVPVREECIRITREFFDKWNCDSIFLSTMYEDTIPLFQDEFGTDKVHYIDRDRWNLGWQLDHDLRFEQHDNMIENEISYIKEIVFLSKCTSLLSAVGGQPWLVGCIKEDVFDELEWFPYEYPYGYGNTRRWEDTWGDE